MQANRSITLLGFRRVEGQDLVVAGKEGFVEALVVGVALLDITQVPLAMERGGVANFRQYLGEGDLFLTYTMAFEQHSDVVHTATHG